MNNKSQLVNDLLARLNHPMILEIDKLRQFILETDFDIIENIKWNGPNYSFNNIDRITIKIHPPTKIQLILHCGVKAREQNNKRFISHESSFLKWITNDRCLITFKNLIEIENSKNELNLIINNWLRTEI
jgi:hypothetical protein